MSLQDRLKSTGTLSLQRLIDATIDFGKSAVHALMPDDYEYYLCSFELYNSKMDRKGF